MELPQNIKDMTRAIDWLRRSRREGAAEFREIMQTLNRRDGIMETLARNREKSFATSGAKGDWRARRFRNLQTRKRGGRRVRRRRDVDFSEYGLNERLSRAKKSVLRDAERRAKKLGGGGNGFMSAVIFVVTVVNASAGADAASEEIIVARDVDNAFSLLGSVQNYFGGAVRGVKEDLQDKLIGSLTEKLADQLTDMVDPVKERLISSLRDVKAGAIEEARNIAAATADQLSNTMQKQMDKLVGSMKNNGRELKAEAKQFLVDISTDLMKEIRKSVREKFDKLALEIKTGVKAEFKQRTDNIFIRLKNNIDEIIKETTKAPRKMATGYLLNEAEELQRSWSASLPFASIQHPFHVPLYAPIGSWYYYGSPGTPAQIAFDIAKTRGNVFHTLNETGNILASDGSPGLRGSMIGGLVYSDRMDFMMPGRTVAVYCVWAVTVSIVYTLVRAGVTKLWRDTGMDLLWQVTGKPIVTSLVAPAKFVKNTAVDATKVMAKVVASNGGRRVGNAIVWFSKGTANTGCQTVMYVGGRAWHFIFQPGKSPLFRSLSMAAGGTGFYYGHVAGAAVAFAGAAPPSAWYFGGALGMLAGVSASAAGGFLVDKHQQLVGAAKEKRRRVKDLRSIEQWVRTSKNIIESCEAKVLVLTKYVGRIKGDTELQQEQIEALSKAGLRSSDEFATFLIRFGDLDVNTYEVWQALDKWQKRGKYAVDFQFLRGIKDKMIKTAQDIVSLCDSTVQWLNWNKKSEKVKEYFISLKKAAKQMSDVKRLPSVESSAGQLVRVNALQQQKYLVKLIF